MATELLSVLVDSAWRGTILLGFAWGMTAVMRRTSASMRHHVWAAAIVAAALVPVTVVALQRWPLSAPFAMPALSTIMAPSAANAEASANAFAPRVAGPQRTAGSHDVAASVRRRLGQAAVRLDAARLAATVWAVGAIGVFLYLVVSVLYARRLQRSAKRVEAPGVDEAQALARHVGIRLPITLAESAMAPVPLVCGVWRPVIVLPSGAGKWSSERLRVVILHELAHIKRRDYLMQPVALAVCAAYWFNPLAWVAARALRTECERACDDIVLATGTKGSVYARHLLEIARSMQLGRRPLPAALSIAHRSELEQRLIAILDPGTCRSSGVRARLAAVAAMLLLSIPVSAVQLTPGSPDASRPAQARDFQWVGTLAPGATLEVRGMAGQIRTITSIDGRIHVDARIADPARVRVDVVKRESGVTLCTVLSTPDGDRSECQPGLRERRGQPEDVRVDFIVQVPPGVRFTGSMVHGNIQLDDPVSDVTVATHTGSIALNLSRSRGAVFLANVISGTIDSDVPLHDSTPPLPSGDPLASPRSPRIARATVGTGGPALRVTTIAGNIRLRLHE